MTLDQHIAELRAELDQCVLTEAERMGARAELAAALAKWDRELARGAFLPGEFGEELEAA